MRKLASIRKIKELFPIKGADVIEAARVDGWVCIVKKGEFQLGDLGVYFEIDSFLPGIDPRYSFLESKFITYEGNKGARLRTIRLKKQIGQGLILPLARFPELQDAKLGDDVTEILGIQKWEPYIPAQLAGQVKGNFPSFISKSEQERVQNLVEELEEHRGEELEVSIKLDGASMTVYRNQTEEGINHGVCGRNWELKETDTNSMWRVTRKDKMLEALDFLGRNLAFQGEIIGEGIASNPEKIKGQAFYLYNIFDIDRYSYVSPEERFEIIEKLKENGFNIKHVPVLPTIILHHSVDELLMMAEGTSLNPQQQREGLVFKSKNSDFSFKAISNWYLEKNGH